MERPGNAWLRAQLDRANDAGLTITLVAFLASRGVLLWIGLLARGVLWPLVGKTYQWRYHPSDLWDMWGVFDTGGYLEIMEVGYSIPAPDAPGSTLAFFPVYPLTAKVLSLVTGDTLIAGVLLSNVCFFGALWLLFDLVRARTDAGTARLAVLLAAFVPGSYVFSSMYTEALFLLLLLGSISYARRDRWLMAGMLGAVLSGTRLLGLAVGLPLFLLWFERFGPRGFRQAGAWARLATLALVPVGLLAWMRFLAGTTGDPLAFLHVQVLWDRVFQNPVTALLTPLWSPNLYNIYQTSVGLACFAALIPVARRRLWPELALALALLMVPLCNGAPYAPLESYARYCLVVWPVYLGLALVLGGRPTATGLAFGVLAALNGLFMVFWATGMFFAI